MPQDHSDHSQVRDFLQGMKAVVSRVESLEADLASARHRNAQLETVIRIMARRNEGKLLWSTRELDAAVADERCVMLGALDLELYGNVKALASPPLTTQTDEQSRD